MGQSNVDFLSERAKELDCIYSVDDVLYDKELSLPGAMKKLLDVIPIGFLVPELCRIQITLWDQVYQAQDFEQAKPVSRTPIASGKDQAGEVVISYLHSPQGELPQLLEYETRLIRAIARRISFLALDTRREIDMLLHMLYSIEPDILMRIAVKMQVYLQKTAGSEADELFENLGLAAQHIMGEVNAPQPLRDTMDITSLWKIMIEKAATYLPVGTITKKIMEWIRQHRIGTLVKTVDSKDASTGDIFDAISKYTEAVNGLERKNNAIEHWLIAELAHRFLTANDSLIKVMQDHFRIEDFKPIIEHVIGSANSMGNIGGKGSGIFIAQQILRHQAAQEPLLAQIKTPHTWYLATDQIVDFLHYNNLEDLNAFKYHSISYLQATYGGVVDRIMQAKLPPQTVQMLRIVLEDFGDRPLIVRSSSLLEDRQTGAFSGKYKSLFLTNRGNRTQQLACLEQAILEIYASMYSPDAIQYRAQRGMMNFNEQMGILIQEVVGQPVDKYFLPAFAGVAYSHNLLRWSTRVNREDGLVRAVLGLGTRAVDRVNDDYPVLFSPGQPKLQINQKPEEAMHYGPKFMDVLNLENGQFETVEILPFLRQYGKDFRGLHRYVSVYHDQFLESKSAFALNPRQDQMVVTLQPLIDQGVLPKVFKKMLDVLSQKYEGPVDLEFAYNGEDLYLLQCRPHNFGLSSKAVTIPDNIPPADILFTANRYITDGALQDITHIVYVDAGAYNSLPTREDLLQTGRIVGQLNALLPRRKFLLMGPGRWGSRGDIKLGVPVTYSDISNCAALIEVAKESQSYVPELSFGTHFFQDLVEAGILYLPLYPGQGGAIFKEDFFLKSENQLPRLLPEFSAFDKVVYVLEVPQICPGQGLSLLMNGEVEKAVCYLNHLNTSEL